MLIMMVLKLFQANFQAYHPFVIMLTMMVLKLLFLIELIIDAFVTMLTMMVLKPYNMFILKLLFFTRCFKIKHCLMIKE